MQPERLMKAADLALYRAKQEGRGTWRFFESGMDAVARTRRALEIDLRSAVPMRQLELYYQPIVWSGDRSLTGFEALLRWHHPVHGIMRPDEFLSTAEESGLIGEIGAWVLQQACAEAMTWPDHLRVSVNLSTRQFRTQNLVKVVGAALETSGLPPERLELEITELVPLRQNNTTLSTLHELQALGARIALDDFGTGFSSLSYLRGFPFDTVKIDKSFVADLQTREDSVLLMRGMVGLATKLRMNVTAEGVETEGQFDILVEAGCTEIQGFLISKPVTAVEIPRLIERLSGRGPYLEKRPVVTLFPVAAKH
jgi:EAL domain-containing protein (putative c-di-GMP-specific phosphodiesterase class I)